jgi:hypothetical protein
MIYKTKWGPMTDEAPTEDGYYWVDPKDSRGNWCGKLAAILWDHDELFTIGASGRFEWPKNVRRTLSPIPEPKVVKDED